jgi:hypothetical protein
MDFVYNLLPHQMKMLRSKSPLNILCAGRAAGKSYIVSLIIALGLNEGKSIVATAQTYRLLKFVLFTEVQKRLNEMNISYSFSSIDMTIKVNNATLYGFSGDKCQVDSIRGLSNISILVMDEAALSTYEFFQVCSATLRGLNVKDPKIYLISTPKASSWFDQYCNDNIEVVISASSYDNKFLDTSYFDILERLYTGDFLKQEIYGQMIQASRTDQLIDTNDIIRNFHPAIIRKITSVGIDVARFGDDNTVCYGRDGYNIKRLFKINKGDSYQIVNNLKPNIDKTTHINIDGTGGYASGVVDILKKEGYLVNEINFGSSSDNPYAFNKRSEIYLNMKDELKTQQYSINRETNLLEDLKAQRYTLDNLGRIKLIPKDEIKKDLGRSPDDSDALALCMYSPKIIYNVDDRKMKLLIDN